MGSLNRTAPSEMFFICSGNKAHFNHGPGLEETVTSRGSFASMALIYVEK